ncbi:helix-turn-helix transcriptional regulator [Salinarimonas soli]|uniref:helix-turn-helix transcriptional regulator n=1 Tax=Salinarimonas soli TaxID=1638099 RepID=UPI001661CF69|nr:WYL domain-containing protein [Salinarimonas soli]
MLLSEARGGLTLDQMADQLNVGRRTVERMRDALDRLTGGALVSSFTDDGMKRWTLPSDNIRAFAVPDLDELATLKLAARNLRQQGNYIEAERLERLTLKLEAAMPRPTLRRLEPDVEVLLEASGVLLRPGPRAKVDSHIIDQLQQALLSNRQIRLTYNRRDGGGVSHPRLHPYGFLAGSRDYLVAFNTHPEVQEHRLYVLANIDAVQVLSDTFERDPAFDLSTFASRSFGAFWEGERFDVLWRFNRDAAADARRFHFHPNQVVTDQPDGSVLVAFTAAGLTEMAWHLFTWGDAVEIISPDALKQRFRDCLAAARTALGVP